jgi:hypothetical protein
MTNGNIGQDYCFVNLKSEKLNVKSTIINQDAQVFRPG